MRLDAPKKLSSVFCGITSKVCYHSRRAAKKAGKRKGSKYSKCFDVYPCPHCCLWHLATDRLRDKK